MLRAAFDISCISILALASSWSGLVLLFTVGIGVACVLDLTLYANHIERKVKELNEGG